MNFMDDDNDHGMLPLELDVKSVKALLDGPEPPVLLDIREPLEVQVCQIPGSIHIPMGEIPLRWQSLATDKRIIIYCHHGRRSLMVTNFLRHHGLENTQSMLGGINAWSFEIDPTIARY